jgi:hypothetical protein
MVFCDFFQAQWLSKVREAQEKWKRLLQTSVFKGESCAIHNNSSSNSNNNSSGSNNNSSGSNNNSIGSTKSPPEKSESHLI